ncbi:MAG: hydrolase [Bacillota bacterium]
MRILKEDVMAVHIDFQEKLFPAIHEHEEIERKVCMLVEGLNAFDVPYLVSQQYTKGLGETVPAVRSSVGDSFSYMEKTTFSCWETEELQQYIRDQGKRVVVVTGVEAHICVMQTVIDLLAAGFTVFVVADCVGSRSKYDKKIALRRMQDEGAFLTTTESLLFELTKGAKAPQFKMISKLVK